MCEASRKLLRAAKSVHHTDQFVKYMNRLTAGYVRVALKRMPHSTKIIISRTYCFQLDYLLAQSWCSSS